MSRKRDLLDRKARQTTTIAQDKKRIKICKEKRNIALDITSKSIFHSKITKASYYNLHTADAHIDLFKLYKILEETRKKAERQALF